MTDLNDIKVAWQKVMESLNAQNEFLNEIQSSRWGLYSLHTLEDGRIETVSPANTLAIDNHIAERAAFFNEMIDRIEPSKIVRNDECLSRLFDIKELLKKEKSPLISPRFFDTLDEKLLSMIEKTEKLLEEFDDLAIKMDTETIMSH